MSLTRKLLAFDLGAESGRAVLGLFDGARLTLEEIHRFPNGPVRILDTLCWDVLRLYEEMLTALRKAASQPGGIDSLGVDTWGVDFALLGRDGTLLANPRHYRDPMTEGAMETAFARVPRAAIFQKTGLQFLRFNTLFQLVALQRDRSPLLDVAETLLFIPDLFHYFFTGIKVNEFTDASTSQMLDPHTRQWNYDLLNEMGLPHRFLANIVPPGTELGPLRSSIVSDTGAAPAAVVVPATHDTASAVAAVPAVGDSWAYLSSGTWSLLGVEISRPVINDRSLAYNFTNEGGVDGTVRLLKNVMGLWLLQECRRAWQREGKHLDYDDLIRQAEQAAPWSAIIDPDDPSFLLPPHMPTAIAAFCRKTRQPEPILPDGMVRCILESLALRYRWVVERLEELTGRQIKVIHVVGGGSQNRLLCQFTADACDRAVIAGPVEATAIGNVLVQAIGRRLLGSLAEAREVVRQSFGVQSYFPQNPDDWQAPYRRFLDCIKSLS